MTVPPAAPPATAPSQGALLDLVAGAAGLPVVVVGDAVLDGWLAGPSARL